MKKNIRILFVVLAAIMTLIAIFSIASCALFENSGLKPVGDLSENDVKIIRNDFFDYARKTNKEHIPKWEVMHVEITKDFGTYGETTVVSVVDKIHAYPTEMQSFSIDGLYICNLDASQYLWAYYREDKKAMSLKDAYAQGCISRKELESFAATMQK